MIGHCLPAFIASLPLVVHETNNNKTLFCAYDPGPQYCKQFQVNKLQHSFEI